jgi:WS/DGAT/MGAT family acyltransferase
VKTNQMPVLEPVAQPSRGPTPEPQAGHFDRLTASDRFLLWDDYGWSSDMGAVVLLDGAPLLDSRGGVRLEVVRQHVESRLHLVPRFRQCLYRPRRGLGWPLWVDAPHFDIADHVRVHFLGPATDEADLIAACEELMRRPFDPSRPLWELWLLTGLPERQLAAVLKLHHVIADGTAALAVFGALLDDGPNAPRPAAPPWHPTPMPTPRQLLGDNLRRRRRELRRAWSGLIHLGRTVRQARVALPAWREVLTDKPAPKTSLNRPVGTHRDLAVVRSHLDAAKRAARASNAKVNDVVLAAVAGGLRDLLATRGELVDGLTQRAMVTISQHDEKAGRAQGNKPGWMMVSLPLGEPDPARRLELIAAETAARKQRARPEAGSGIFRFMAAQRLWYRLFPRQRSVNIVVSNVPGPPFAVYLAGAEVLDLIPLMPTMGNLTLVVAALSYVGQLNLAAAGDRDLCPDLNVFADGVRTSLDALASSVHTP